MSKHLPFCHLRTPQFRDFSEALATNGLRREILHQLTRQPCVPKIISPKVITKQTYKRPTLVITSTPCDDMADDIQATALTLRFKYQKHTILLFVEPLTPFKTIKSDLYEVLRDRYGPNSNAPPENQIKLPSSPNAIALAIPIDIYEPSKGWQRLHVNDTDTPKGKGIKDVAALAFSFIEEDAEDDEVEFVVEWSSYDEQYGDGVEGDEGRNGVLARIPIKPPIAIFKSAHIRHLIVVPVRPQLFPSRLKMSPPPLEKQYMSSTTKPKKQNVEPRPSASILLISPKNQILLLHRVRTSSSFPSAHVFPGGNLSALQDGPIPSPSDPRRHLDSPIYRLGAIRECFEESGILLAKRNDGSGRLLEVDEAERERARKDIHAGRVKFNDWVEKQGGIVDLDSLLPFTRWVTPNNIPRRFTTQMYIYFLPLSRNSESTPNISEDAVIPIPTSDGGVEHTTAQFATCETWLSQARRNEIILFPPQFYLMYLLSPLLSPPSPVSSELSTAELQSQRDKVLSFLQTDGDGKGVKWADKVMSPVGLMVRKSDGRSVLGIDKPGPELNGSGRRGDELRVVLVKFSKEGPRNVEVMWRKDVKQQTLFASTHPKLAENILSKKVMDPGDRPARTALVNALQCLKLRDRELVNKPNTKPEQEPNNADCKYISRPRDFSKVTRAAIAHSLLPMAMRRRASEDITKGSAQSTNDCAITPTLSNATLSDLYAQPIPERQQTSRMDQPSPVNKNLAKAVELSIIEDGHRHLSRPSSRLSDNLVIVPSVAVPQIWNSPARSLLGDNPLSIEGLAWTIAQNMENTRVLKHLQADDEGQAQIKGVTWKAWFLNYSQSVAGQRHKNEEAPLPGTFPPQSRIIESEEPQLMEDHWPNYQIDKSDAYRNLDPNLKEDYVCAEGLCWASQIPSIPAKYTLSALEGRALYMRGIPFQWTTAMSAAMFSIFGRVTGCPCVSDSVSGDRFRWLVMSTVEEVNRIIVQTRDMVIFLEGLTVEVARYPGDGVRKRSFCPVLPPQPAAEYRGPSKPTGYSQTFDPAISRPKFASQTSNTDVLSLEHVLPPGINYAATGSSFAPAKASGEQNGSIAFGTPSGIFDFSTTALTSTMLERSYHNQNLVQHGTFQPDARETQATQSNSTQLQRLNTPGSNQPEKEDLHTDMNKVIGFSLKAPQTPTSMMSYLERTSVWEQKFRMSNPSTPAQSSPSRDATAMTAKEASNNETANQLSVLGSRFSEPPFQSTDKTVNQASLATKPSGLSWAAVAGSPLKNSRVIDLRPRETLETANTLNSSPNKNINTSRHIEQASEISSPEPKEVQMRVVFLLDIPNNITYEIVSDAIHEGPLHSIRFGINGDNNSRFCGIVFRYSSDARKFYASLQVNEGENPHIARRFRWNVKSAMGPPFPADDIINAMTWNNDAPYTTPATRRLTLVKSQLFSQYSEGQLEDMFAKVVRREFIQRIFLYNSGNATVIFAGVQEAIAIKKHLEKMERRASNGDGVPPIFDGLTVMFSRDPCEQPLRFISSVNMRKRSKFN
ncbi:hypothetical protein B7463_g3612, partial [Scytalidium lignicola]